MISTHSSLAGRRVLVTGAGNGTGLAAARAIHEQGGEVLIGTRSMEKFEKAAQLMGHVRAHPFVADLTDPGQVGAALSKLEAEGALPTDVLHSAAGGLEPILRLLLRGLVGLKRIDESERTARIEEFRSRVVEAVAESADHAFKINLEATKVVTEALLPHLEAGASVIYFSSLWSTFHGRMPTPSFYGSVSSSKRALELWMAEQAPGWIARGIRPTVISGHVITDTSLGEVISKYLVPLRPPEIQAELLSYFVESPAMVEATLRALDGDGAPSVGLRYMYVVGPGNQILDDMGDDHPSLDPIF